MSEIKKDSSVASDAPAPQRRKKPASLAVDQIDIRDALEGPVRIKRDGGAKPVDPYEALLRQHVRKSLVERSVASIKLVLERHKIIKQPSPPIDGGIFIVPKDLPDEIQRQIFDYDPADGNSFSMGRIWGLLLTVIDMERLKRCFNGR